MSLAHGGSITLKTNKRVRRSVWTKMVTTDLVTDVMNQLTKSEREDARSVDPAQASAAALQDDLHMNADDYHGAVDQPVQEDEA